MYTGYPGTRLVMTHCRRLFLLLIGLSIAHGANPDFTLNFGWCCFVTAVTADRDGSVYLTGTVTGANLATTPGAFQTTAQGVCIGGGAGNYAGPGVTPCQNAFVTKVNSDGSIAWSTYWGRGAGLAIAVDSSGNVYVAGFSDVPTTLDAAFPATPGSTTQGASIAKLNSGGSNLIYSTRLPGIEDAVSMALDASGAVYVSRWGGR